MEYIYHISPKYILIAFVTKMLNSESLGDKVIVIPIS